MAFTEKEMLEKLLEFSKREEIFYLDCAIKAIDNNDILGIFMNNAEMAIYTGLHDSIKNMLNINDLVSKQIVVKEMTGDSRK